MTKLVTKFASVYNQLSHCALTKSMGIVYRLALGDADKYRTGFKKAMQDRDYATIITVTEKIPNNVLE